MFPDLSALRRAAEDPAHASTCFYPLADQSGVNLLRLVSGVPLTNLTMLPVGMESTWAGDYADADYDRYWPDDLRRPYLIHWAGTPMHEERPIHELFYRYLSAGELEQWHAQVRAKGQPDGGLKPRLHRYKRQAQRVWDALVDG